LADGVAWGISLNDLVNLATRCSVSACGARASHRFRRRPLRYPARPRRVATMPTWVCDKCKTKVDGRCRPAACPKCKAPKDSFTKK
jgi:rubrerythrin